jgi:hypothetical protein
MFPTESCASIQRSIVNFFGEYQNLADSLYLFDNTTAKPGAVAF